MSAADRMARRHTKQRGAVERCPVRVSQVPTTQAERYALERECLKAAKKAGRRGVQARILATRYYNAAVAEASRQVREPSTQASVLTRPGRPVPTPPAPRGMQQAESGLYVPVPA
jgi:hypothetical protein